MPTTVSPTDRPRRDPLKGFSYALAGTVLISTNYVMAKYGLKGFNPAAFSLVWTSGAAFYALLIVLASGRRRELALPATAVRKVVLLGLTTAPLMLCAWYGLRLLDPLFAGFLWRFSPVLAIVFGAALLRERLSLGEILALAVMVLGGSLSTMGRWHIVGLGIVLVLASCVLGAVQQLLARMTAAEVDPGVLVFYRCAIAVPLLALWVFATGKADFHVGASYWLVMLLGAFLGPCAGHMMTFRAYRHWELSRVSIVRTMQPLLILPMAYLAFGKLPALQEMLGGGLIFIGALWIARIQLLSKDTA